jgi:hypothetical protein
MENNNFKVRIIDFYKNINKPIIDKMITDNSFKNILELSTVSEIPLLKKEKNNWYLKDKKKILKEIETTKKKKIKEMKNNLSKINIIKINDIKENNNKLITDLESIDLLKNNIEDDIIYNNIKNLSLLSNNIDLTKKTKKKQLGGTYNLNIKNNKKNLKIIKINLDELNLSSDSNDFIEIFSN